MRGTQVFNIVRHTLRRYKMLSKGDRVLLCVSGGADSVFLAHVFNYLKDELGVSLYIANLDHGIRGVDSKKDSAFVRDLAGRLGVRLIFKRFKFRKDKKHSVEETARRLRYGFFYDTAKKKKINVVATAHTRDDQAETVLIRIIKGTSIKGLTGIPPVRIEGKIKFIRPLIELNKTDILAIMRNRRFSYRTDKSNFDNKIFRNAVRNRILPFLEKYNPRIKRALFNMAETLREDHEVIKHARDSYGGKIAVCKGKVRIKINELMNVPKAVQKEVIRDAVAKLKGNLKRLTYGHWRSIRALLETSGSGKSLDLPGKIRITKNKNDIVLSKK